MLPKHAVRRRRLGLSVAIAVFTSLFVFAPPAPAFHTTVGHVAGHVTDDTGTAVAGLCVEAYPDGTGTYRSTFTSSTGWYRLTVNPGDYRISFEEDCVGGTVVGEWYDDKPSEDAADLVTVTTGTTQTADAELERASSFSGVVTDDNGGGSLAGICVTAYDDEGMAFGADFATVTGSYRTSVTGYYRVGGLPPGSYSVEYWDCNPSPLYLTEWWNDRPTMEDADPVALTEDQHTTGMDVGLTMGSSFEGVVRDPENVPLRQACVDAYDTAGSWVGSTVTSNTGYYRLGALEGGSYKARFQDCDRGLYAYEWWNDKADRNRATPIVLDDDDRLLGYNATLGYDGRIWGVVRRGATTLSDVCVDVYDPVGDYVGGAITSVTGWYQVRTLRTGTYKVFAEDCGDRDYGEEWYRDKDDEASATPVEVTAGNAEYVEIDLGKVPNAPSGVTATPGNGSAVVTWTAPSSESAPISFYTVTASPGGTAKATTGTSTTVNGLTNGTAYTFTVTATNLIGYGPPSAASAPVTPTAPPAPPALPPPDPAPSPPATAGYRMATSDGALFTFGTAGFFGSLGGVRLNQPIVGVADTPSGNGYWLVARDGGVFSFGDARFHGSTGAIRLNQPIVGMASTPTGNGYWLVAADGGVFAFGDARFHGSTGAIRLNQPIVGMASTPTGNGYWLVARDGGIFAFGDARFFGSTGGIRLNQPIVGMAAAPSGDGYWLVASDGGIFAFGSARFHGSTGAIRLNQPIIGMAATPTGDGYWLVARDGGVFGFGQAPFLGSTGGSPPSHPMVGVMS